MIVYEEKFEREAERFLASTGKKDRREMPHKRENQRDSMNSPQTREKRVQERRNKYI